jgi:hypothetical protein
LKKRKLHRRTRWPNGFARTNRSTRSPDRHIS